MPGRCQGEKNEFFNKTESKRTLLFLSIKGTEAVMLEHVLFFKERLPHNKVFHQDAAASL